MERMVRLIDVANKAGVSRVAAGRVLLGSGSGHVRTSDATAKRIRKCALEMGYQPNRSAQRLKGKTGCLLGAVMKTNSTEIELKRLIALERVAFKHGHQLLIAALSQERKSDPVDCVSMLAAQGAAGIIFITAGTAVARRMAEASISIPVVCCDIPTTIGQAPGVILDLAHGYRQAVQHFVRRGRKRIGLLNIGWRGFADSYLEYRLNVVRKEAASLGGVEISDFTVTTAPGKQVPSLNQTGAAVAAFMKSGVDAILAYSDTAAARLVQVLTARGLRVPDDVAICGLSNLEIGEIVSPQLTTIDERPKDVAEAMLELMLAQLNNTRSSTCQRVIQAELIIRGSS